MTPGINARAIEPFGFLNFRKYNNKSINSFFLSSRFRLSMQLIKILIFLFVFEIFTGCRRLMYLGDKHYYSLNYYKKQAKRFHINSTKIPDLTFNGYIKTYVSLRAIDGGPLLEEWGYKFDVLD